MADETAPDPIPNPDANGPPLYGPIPGSTKWGDAALFEDEAGTVVARVMIAPVFAVPILVVADGQENRPHEDYRGLVARCPLLGAPEQEGYRGWDDPRFRNLCQRFGIDPDKQRPTFDAWCRDVGEALLETAMAAFEAKRFDEHGAAGKAAEALAQGATPADHPIDDVSWRLDAIQDEGLRTRTRDTLEQLERSADWQAGKRRTETSRMRGMIDAATEAGTPVTIVEDADGPGGTVVFGDTDDLELGRHPTWRERVKRWFR